MALDGIRWYKNLTYTRCFNIYWCLLSSHFSVTKRHSLYPNTLFAAQYMNKFAYTKKFLKVCKKHEKLSIFRKNCACFYQAHSNQKLFYTLKITKILNKWLPKSKTVLIWANLFIQSRENGILKPDFWRSVTEIFTLNKHQ